MENDSLFLENKWAFGNKFSRPKAAMVASVLAVMVSFLLFLIGVVWWEQTFFYNALPAVFLLSGCVHLYFLTKNLPGLANSGRWLLTMATALVVAALLGFSALWIEQITWMAVLASVAAFLLPFCLSELWLAYAAVSFSGFRYWQLTNETTDDLPAFYLKSIKVRFKIIQEPAIGGSRIIPVSASVRFKLSEVFFDVVQKQNKSGSDIIALRSRELEPYTWVFYKMDMQLWYRALDPDKSLVDNGIGQNALIYAQRVSKNAFENSIEKEEKLRQQ